MSKFLNDIEWVDINGLTQGTARERVVLGRGAEGTNAGNIAISEGAKALGETTIAIGMNAVAEFGTGGGIAFGDRTRIDAWNGAAIAIGSYAAVGRDCESAISIGVGAHIDRGRGAVLIGPNAYIGSGDESVLIGSKSYTSGDGSVVVGAQSVGSGDGIAIGRAACTHSGAVAIGPGSNADYFGGISIGSGARNIGENSILIGHDAFNSNDCSIVIGSGASNRKNNLGSIVIGHSSSVGDASNYGTSSSLTVIGYNVQMHECQDSSYFGSGNSSEYPMFLNGYMNSVILGNYNTNNLICNATSISYFSDSRLKEDVSDADIDRCLQDVARLPVKRYKYKKFAGNHRDVHRTGFLADDVESVFPKDVYVHPEMEYELRDENGNLIMDAVLDQDGNQVIEDIVNPTTGEAIPTPKYRPRKIKLENVKMISMEMATPTLWGAVQALNKKTQSMEKEINNLRSEVAALKGNRL